VVGLKKAQGAPGAPSVIGCRQAIDRGCILLSMGPEDVLRTKWAL
jgi:hypothetical protein